MLGEYIPPSFIHLCNLLFAMFHFGDDYIHPTKDPNMIFQVYLHPKGKLTSSFTWTSLFRSPTQRSLCLGDCTLSRINQFISVSMCERVFCATKSATKPPNTKTTTYMYLQEEPSTTPSDEPSRDTDKAR